MSERVVNDLTAARAHIETILPLLTGKPRGEAQAVLASLNKLIAKVQNNS